MTDTLTVTDNRTGRSFELPVFEGTFGESAIDGQGLAQIRVTESDPGLRILDPGLRHTATCKSAITYVDGENGILRYRGYPIETLTERATYLEVAHLLIYGDLPDDERLEAWREKIAHHSLLHESFRRHLEGFNYGSHTMGMFVGSLGALSTFYQDVPDDVDEHAARLIGQVATVAAFGYRHSRGLPCLYPRPGRDYCQNLLSMLFGDTEGDYEPDPVLVRALNVLLILHADHEQNCGTNVMRSIGSAGTDPCSALAGAAAALYGPAHGGANEAALRVMGEIGEPAHVPAFLDRVRRKEVVLPGFGHPVYRNYDPRARIIKDVAHEVFEVTGRNALLDVALEVERIALEDDYFVSRRLYPNVDFYSGLIYQSLGLPLDMMTVLFAIPRTSGWLAQWREMLDGQERIARPRQIYVGEALREI